MATDPLTYLPEVAWETIAKDVITIDDLTYWVTVKPENINQVGAGQVEVDYLFTDNTGDTYLITGINVDGKADQIELTDSFHCYKTPASDRTAIICKAVGFGKAPFLSPSMLDRLDPSAKDKIRSFEIDILWKKNFIQLLDCPDSYEGQSLQTLRVKEDETGVEFVDKSIMLDGVVYEDQSVPQIVGTILSRLSKLWTTAIQAVTGIFETSIQAPLISGGTESNSKITYKSTSGTAAPSNIAHQWIGGTDGGTVLSTMLNDGKLGLLTQSPTQLLHLNGGNILLDGSGSKTITLTRTSGASTQFGASTLAGGAYFKTITNSPMYIGANNANYITILGNGSVGISNLTPTQTMSIVGNLQVTGGLIKIDGFASDTAIRGDRLVNDATGSGNAHFIQDAAIISRTGTMAYASYDNRSVWSSGTYDHHSAFQSAPNFNSGVSLANYYGFYDLPTLTAATLTNRYGVRILNPALVSGATLTNNYAIFIDTQTSGTNRWAIYQSGTSDVNYFAGIIKFANGASVGKIWKCTNIDGSGQWTTPSFEGLPEDISFEFRDITPGTSQTYILDIKASFGYTIEALVAETDTGTLTGVSVKIGSTDVTSLSSVTITTLAEMASTGAKTVVAGNQITISTSSGYTGTPTTLRGKIKILRT